MTSPHVDLDDPRVLAAKARLELALKVQKLANLPEWRALVDQCQTMRQNAFLMLATKDLTPRSLGFWQGFMSALSVISVKGQKADDEVKKIEAEIQQYAGSDPIEVALAEAGIGPEERNELLVAAGLRQPQEER